MKKCKKCLVEKIFDDFTKDSRSKDGKQRICRDCNSEYYASRSKRYMENAIELPDSRQCPDCKLELPISEFYQSKLRSNGTYTYCKKCSNNRRSASMYNIPLETYVMLIAGGCEICKSFESLCVDHDHSCCPENISCGKCVRGILCRSCNLAEGQLRGDPELALKLYHYLKKFE